jgi:hypothetical protein
VRCEEFSSAKWRGLFSPPEKPAGIEVLKVDCYKDHRIVIDARAIFSHFWWSFWEVSQDFLSLKVFNDFFFCLPDRERRERESIKVAGRGKIISSFFHLIFGSCLFREFPSAWINLDLAPTWRILISIIKKSCGPQRRG